MHPDLVILLIIPGWSLLLGSACYWRGVNAEQRRAAQLRAVKRHPSSAKVRLTLVESA